MNAATRRAGSVGREAPPDGPDGTPPPWPDDGDPVLDAAADLADDDPPADPIASPSQRPATAFSEAQLAAWLDAIVDQDERALAALYDATFSRVFGLVQRIVRQPAMAEEVVEDTYFQVWRQAVRFDPARGKALTWLMAIARSRAIDAVRHEARHRHDALDEGAGPEPVDETPAADELLELARHQADLHEALMRLGAQPRQLVSLAFFRGLSHEEIAQHTRLPLGTVKSQIRRALLTLRQILGERGPNALAS